MRACLELLGRVTGELDGRATTNIAVVLGELAASGRQAIAANPHARVLDIVAPEDSQSSGVLEQAPDQHVSGAGHTKSPPSEAQRP